MGIINPESNAIDNFLWVTAQEGMKTILEAVSSAQASINSDYAFQVKTNLYRPSIEEIENTSLVNLRIAQVATLDETNSGVTQRVTIHADCYVRGNSEDDPEDVTSLIPADEVAVQKLHYLVAMVYRGITDLANFYQTLSSGQIIPGKIGIAFNPVENAEDSFEPYAPAQVTFECDFPYVYQDLTNLPGLEAAKVDLGVWAAQIFNT